MSNTIEEPEIAEEGGLSPEDALFNVEAQLRATQEEAARERQARADAESRAAQADNAVVGAHAAAIDGAISAAKSQLDAAERDFIAAREAGDVSAEARANRLIASLAPRLDRLEEQKAQIARQPAPQAQPSGGNVPGPDAQRWLAEHPKSRTDPVYRAALGVVHDQAVQAGLAVESPEYFKFAERELAARFGANHGKDEPVNKPNGAGARRPATSSTAAPLSRGGNAGARGASNVRDIVARLNEMHEGEDPITVADIEEIAQSTWPKLDRDAAIKRYVESQEQILGQRQSVQNTGNGKHYRI